MKKFLSAVLVFAILSCVTVFADDKAAEFEDVKSFGIMQTDEDGNMNFEASVTRGEMAQIVVNAAGLSGVDAATLPVDGFSDVGDKHWAYNAITVAQSIGFINGNGDGTFTPNDNVTYEQAIKMIVVLLGYEPLALQRGGYPAGYLTVAKQIGLTEEMKFKNSDTALRYDIASLMEKALNTPIMGQTAYGEVAEYTIFDGKDGRELVTLKNNLE